MAIERNESLLWGLLKGRPTTVVPGQRINLDPFLEAGYPRPFSGRLLFIDDDDTITMKEIDPGLDDDKVRVFKGSEINLARLTESSGCLDALVGHNIVYQWRRR